jgi:hypothetical protein
MRAMLPSVDLSCPYCGETITVLVDDSAGAQRYIEDCRVCCRPIAIDVAIGDDGAIDVVARAEDDA